MAEKALGLGLLSIGRTWGVAEVVPPPDTDAVALIHAAYGHGIRFFDTAPAYGASERLFGLALRQAPAMMSGITIATKMGEFWHGGAEGTVVSHRYDDLARSIETSLEHLGRIDVLQLHKATADSVTAPDVERAFRLAESFGIRRFGASVSDLDTAERAAASGRFHMLQFPLNRLNRAMEPILAILEQGGMQAIINRPLAMGGLAGEGNSETALRDAFGYVLAQAFSGIVLTGTSSLKHLQQNVAAFNFANPP
jgi:aryl-alcohol dehydrogenase-like predicted oxidoreductase